MTASAKVAPAFSRRARFGLFAIATAAFLAALYLQLPASLLLRFLPEMLPKPFAFGPAGVSATGTLWDGKLTGLQAGTVPLELRWQLSPWRVISGSMVGSAILLNRDDRLEGEFALDFAGHGELSNVRGHLQLQSLQPTTASPWRGDVRLDLASVALGSQGPGAIDGNIVIAGLAGPLLAESLGDFRMEWTRGSNQGRISTLRGPIDLRAALLPLPHRGFQLSGEARVAPNANPALHQALAMLGSADANGLYRIAIEFGVSALP